MSRTPSILTRLPRRSTLPTARDLDRRIERVLALATEDDLYHGREWYLGHAVEVIEDVAVYYDIPHRTVAGMLAAMSAGYGWGYSTEAVGVLIEGSRDGIAAPYGWRAIEQAEAIRDGADPDVLLRNSRGWTDTVKRWCFFHNLMGDPNLVTIDVHMARGLTGGVIEASPSSATTYRLLADAVRRAARRHGERPADMQAILWTIIRGAAH